MKTKPECVCYLEDVRDGREPACANLKKLAVMLLDRIGHGYKVWHFDYERANRPVKFIESFCSLPSGKIGVPFVLEPFERCWIQVMFGFVDDDGVRQYQEVLWLMARKNGKALSLDTPIPTSSGWKTMADVHPGDYVFGLDGKPAKVLVESEIFDKPMYRVTFEDGATLDASEDHLWTVQTKASRRIAANGKYSTYHGHQVDRKGWFDAPTKEIAESGVFRERADGKGVEYSYRVPMCNPVEYPERNLPIDPYLLGVWLGDGTSSDNTITIGDKDLDEMLLHLDGFVSDVKRHDDRASTVRVGELYHDKSTGYMHNTVKDELRALGLLDNKHIPEQYLTASAEQRWELLKGLMDTDGYCSNAGQCEFVQKSHDLTMQFAQLCASLGIKVSVTEKQASCNGKDAGVVYRAQFFTDKERSCFKLKRKHERLKDRLANRMHAKSIVSVERIDNSPSKCIAVDDPRHIYLAGKQYTATHNTSLGAALELYMLMADGEGAPQVYNVATSKAQASLAYGAVRKMVRQSRQLSKRLRKGTVGERGEDGIIFDANMGYITPLTNQTRHLDGLDVHFCLFDELAACTNRDQYDLVRQGMSARSQPMMLCITTNGFERGNIFDDRYDYGCRILKGEVDDDRFLPIIYELDFRDEWQDETCWMKANPGLGAIKKWSALRDIVNEAEQNPSILPTVLTKDFNVPENRAAAWLSFGEAVCAEEMPFPIDSNREMPEGERFRYGVAGFDASDTTDLSAACLMMMRPGDDRIYEVKMAWLPEDSLRDDGLRTERDDVPYKLWEKQGLLRIVPGNKVPKQIFLDWLEEVKEAYDVWTFAIGYDPWHVIGTDESNLQMYVGSGNAEVVRQGVKTLSDPMKQIRADFAADRIVDGNNPLSAWARMNVSVKTDVNANIQPVKLGGKAKNRIDPFMAELFAYIALLRHYDEYMAII